MARSFPHRSIIDPDLSLLAGVYGVKVRRRVVVPVHVDEDPIELGQPWHREQPALTALRAPITYLSSGRVPGWFVKNGSMFCASGTRLYGARG